MIVATVNAVPTTDTSHDSHDDSDTAPDDHAERHQHPAEHGHDEPGEGQGHRIHLLTADDVVIEGRRCGTYLTLCGALLAADSLPESLCPEGCRCDLELLYCPACVREAASRSADAGLVDRASGALR